MTTKIYPVCVIGGGSAGVMAVLRTVLNNDETLFFPGSGKDKKKSRALWVYKVENMPGHLDYKKGIEEPNRESLKWLASGEFKGKFAWMKNRGVVKIEKNNDLFIITDSKGESYKAKYVIMATGVMDIQPEINGTIETVFPYANAQTIDYCLRCDGHHVLHQQTGMIGHGNGAAWVACMLYERYQTPSMKIFTNGKQAEFSEEVSELIKLYKIEVYTEKIVKINGDQKTGKLESFSLETRGEIAVDFSFVGLGMIVYNELAVSLNAKVDGRGFVITDDKGLSSLPGLYIAGDLRAGTKKQIYTAWDTAVDSADDINAKIRRERRALLLGK